jgi:trehalose/maltose hydrolase-like predicted phosphorylase
VIQEIDWPVEPWCVRERGLDLDRLARSESLFALSNGHLGLRGNLDEGEPYGIPGTYLNSFYEVGHLELAYDHAYEAALVDLRDLEHNSGDGLHMASLAGVWTALVAGFGGLRDREGSLSFDPRLPDRISRLSFTLRWRDLRLGVDIEPDRVTYTVRDGTDASLTFRHNGKDVTVTSGTPVTEPIGKRPPMLPRPPQPPGREPAHPSESASSGLAARSS